MIEVTITQDEIAHLRPESMEPYVIRKLQDAGIPVRGLLKFGGVEFGELTRLPDFTPDGISMRFVWDETSPSSAAIAPTGFLLPGINCTFHCWFCGRTIQQNTGKRPECRSCGVWMHPIEECEPGHARPTAIAPTVNK